MLFTDSVRSLASAVISDAYIEKIQARGRPDLQSDEQRERTAARLGDESFMHNSYQWDIVTSDGHFHKAGLGGQGLYVAPQIDLVIAWFGTQDERGETEMLTIARQLATSHFFKVP